jgi:hypothetical protein
MMAAKSKSIENLSSQLAEIEEKSEEVNEALEAKSGGTGSGSATEGVLRLREGIKLMTTDIFEMSARIGMLSAELTQSRLSAVTEQSRKHRVKGKSKLRAAGKSTAGKNANTSDDEDDEIMSP